jgi:hypothetical protein
MTLRAGLSILIAALAVSACSSPTKPRTLSSVIVTGTAPAVGASLPFTATAAWSDGSREDVTASASWSSSDTAVLTVSSSGIVTSIASGTAIVTATYLTVTGMVSASVTAVTCNFTVSPLSFSLPKAGDTVTINVTMAGPPCAWDAVSPHSFIHLTTGSTGFGNGTIVATMDPNPELARQGSIIVSHRFVVIFNQRQADCVTALTPMPASLPPRGGVVTVAVAAPSGCTWMASLPSRLVTISGVGGSGNGVFDLAIGPNGTGVTRLNEVTVEQLKLVVPQATPQGTFLVMTGDAADPISLGRDHVAESPSDPFTASATSTSDAHFSIQSPSAYFAGNTDNWDLTLRAPNGQPLVPGTYPNAAGTAGFPAQPYLNLKRGGIDCQPSGSFTVYEALYGPGNTLTRFWASFEQRCQNSPSQVRGQISFGR